ncbi:MAG: hypothetical protein IJ246_11215 [Clostridia bacterium]|nr:hypothetical protein [Clostridia bacterium]
MGETNKKACFSHGTQDIESQLHALGERSGCVRLPAAQYMLESTIRLDRPCIRLEGEVWAYSADPNGVFESQYGTQLRLKGHGFPALSVGITHTAEGCVVRNLGIQGDIAGMDTRLLLNLRDPLADAGLALAHARVDQAEFSKISFCGLQCGICACDDAEVDACLFERLNVDGCAIGAYFAPRAAYYVRFHEWVAADNPYYGLYVNGKDRDNRRMEISKIQFIRTGGAFEEKDGLIHAAVCLENVQTCIFRENLIDDAGVFWYFPPDAVSNSAHETRVCRTVSFYLKGHDNTVADNVISCSHAEAMVVEGDRNILLNNAVDGDVRLKGNGNVVSGLIFTSREARLILEGDENQIWNVPENRVIRKGRQ